MKKFALALSILAVVCSHVYSQNQQANLQKYWNYRDRLRKKFIVIDPYTYRQGTNIPASSIDPDISRADWGDGNNGMSHYLGMLATELWLLKTNNQDYSQTLKELYYAMASMERLDAFSESTCGFGGTGSTCLNTAYTSDINGFYIRDDVSDSFWQANHAHFGVNNFNSIYANDGEGVVMEPISQDNIYHTLEGFALISKLVGVESVQGIPIYFEAAPVAPLIAPYLRSKNILQNGDLTVDFSLWANDWVKRYLHYMQSHSITFTITESITQATYSEVNHWILADPWGNLVPQGNGGGSADGYNTGLFYNVGALEAAKKITGEDLREYGAFLLSNSESEDLFKTIFDAGPDPNFSISVGWPWPFNIAYNSILTVNYSVNWDDYKVRSLGAIGGRFGAANTMSKLRAFRDQSNVHDYEHLPFLYSATNDPDNHYMLPCDDHYIFDINLYETLLNSAPSSGPNSNDLNWSSESRLVWPERLNSVPHRFNAIEYSGLDYMLLHNLYYIAMQRGDLRNMVVTSANSAQNTVGPYGYWANTMTFSNTFPSNMDLVYAANSSITLRPGSYIPRGAKFIGTIRPTSSCDATQYRILTPDGGRLNTHESDAGGVPQSTRTISVVNGTRPGLSTKVQESSSEPASDAMLVYPNPTSGKLKVSKPRGDENYSIEICNLMGQVVWRSSGNIGNVDVDITGTQPGIYTIKVQSAASTKVQRLVVTDRK